MKKILVIDDEPDIGDLLQISLRQVGEFGLTTARDGLTGVRKACEESPDLIVLDLGLPGMSGFKLCEMLSADRATKAIPILILSAMVNEIDRVRGFELGAVDYVTKPFNPREVALRINAIVRSGPSEVAEMELANRNIRVNVSRHCVAVNGRAVDLTAIEFKLLTYLMKTAGRVQPRDRLLNEVWTYHSMLSTRTVDIHVVRLRRKLGKAAPAIETVYGYGYRFTGDRTLEVKR
ncbi:MAG: response regulator transcription factor [Spartobacteria bacterium]